MKERPILFSGPMVRALLDGSKTQTRRVMKPQPIADQRFVGGHYIPATKRTPGQELSVLAPYVHIACPYGQLGDRLWVRETWYSDDYRVQRGPYLKPTDMDLDEARDDGTLIYRASSGDRPYEADQPVWRPAIHMPRWASRITLEITRVRVERLQDISEADAIAEGVRPDPTGRPDDDAAAFHRIGTVRGDSFPIARYGALWEQINGPGSWDANPWVWVIEFRRPP
jgi:hypothetical protein